MKIKQNLFLKILAFLLAVALFALMGVMVYYQATNGHVLWDDYGTTYGYNNQRMFWHGHSDIQELLNRYGLSNLDAYNRAKIQKLESAYAVENTNLRWEVRYDGEFLYGNAVFEPLRGLDASSYSVVVTVEEKKQPAELILWLDPDLPISDDYRVQSKILESAKFHRAELAAATVGWAVLGGLCTLYLCITCGHKKGKDDIYLNWFHRIPGDLLLTVWFFAGALQCVALVELSDYWIRISFREEMVLTALCAAGLACLIVSFVVTFVARCKGRTVLRHTVIGWVLGKLWKLCKWLWRMCRAAVAAIPLIWKTALAGVVYLILSLILVYNSLFVWSVLTVATIAYLCWWAFRWKKVRQGTREIINGNSSYHIDNTKMPPDLREHAGELNNLGQAIGAAVEERIKSERFKTELITNVSHDLKTPLTSIISYVDLLKKENIDNPTAREYIEVLDRKSQRLKKLTEDLVEASKASTGAMSVSRERLDLVQLVDQALGEYEERLNARGLTVVRNLPGQAVWTMADGRHLWRIMDNLLSNCAKYALEGTRVYVELQSSDDRVRLSVKNISRDELNLPVEQLTERFVRGDESRTLEGSGLGLSIAQSLTELQGGDFEIAIDGDLFKVTVILPRHEESQCRCQQGDLHWTPGSDDYLYP